MLIYNHPTSKTGATLYRMVYGGFSRWVITFCLLCALLLQLTHYVEASETGGDTIVPVNMSTVAGESEDSEPPSDSIITDEDDDESNLEENLDFQPEEEVVATTSSIENEQVVESNNATSSHSTTSTATTSTSVGSSTATTSTTSTTSTSTTQSSAGPVGTATNTDSSVGTSSDSDLMIADEHYTSRLTEQTSDANRYQFSAEQCVPMGGGTYHCTSERESDVDMSKVVYAAQSARGVQEIFLHTTEGTIQITDNLYDDTSPTYDSVSQTIVWQRHIDGRYQIMQYSLRTEQEVQLTKTNTNNMEPSVFGRFIVWQAWLDDSWEIMMYDGVDVQRLTDNLIQDIGPSIHGDYILWTSVGREGGQVAKVYVISTGEIVTIPGQTDGLVKNPRFVLIYDTVYANGDVITSSFDPKTGESRPLSSFPRSQPVDVPKPDPTGEVRVLPLNKTEDEEVESDMGTGTSSTVKPTPETDGQIEESENTLDMRASSQTATSVATTTDDIPDLVIAPLATSTNE